MKREVKLPYSRLCQTNLMEKNWVNVRWIVLFLSNNQFKDRWHGKCLWRGEVSSDDVFSTSKRRCHNANLFFRLQKCHSINMVQRYDGTYQRKIQEYNHVKECINNFEQSYWRRRIYLLDDYFTLYQNSHCLNIYMFLMVSSFNIDVNSQHIIYNNI